MTKRNRPGITENRNSAYGGFSLVEMMVAAAILTLLLGATSMIFPSGAGKSHLVAKDQLASLIEQARNRALNSRSTVMLAIAEPGSAPGHPNQCAIGQFQIDGDWSNAEAQPIPGKLLSRWRPLETGMIFLGGEHAGMLNPLDFPKQTVLYSTDRAMEAEVTGIVFNARGRIIHPAGTKSAVLRIAEGGYPGGVATPKKNGPHKRISDTWLKIGRTTGRAREIRP